MLTYENAKWLLNLCSQAYVSTRHTALQVDAASFIANYDLENWDADGVRKTFASFQFKLRVMEIRHRLSRDVYEDEHAALSEELDETIAAARQVIIRATEDPRLRFTARNK